jgi:hypothetical protein
MILYDVQQIVLCSAVKGSVLWCGWFQIYVWMVSCINVEGAFSVNGSL